MIDRDRPGWVTKISKWTERHEIFFHRIIFIVDFESELRIDKSFQFYPWAPIRPFLELSRGLNRSLSN